ncbi:MAG TPA: hypothetical protein VE844_19110 [Gammaproteobacteria bacterium]|nr:hypothetical protein [Gammaproteobacteria bacterium]
MYLAPDDRATGTGAGVDSGISTLVQSLQDQIAYLRQEAEDWKEEARRKDTIILSLTQRLPELQAPVESPGGLQTASEGPTKCNLRGQQEPSQRRSWPHRFYFGP